MKRIIPATLLMTTFALLQLSSCGASHRNAQLADRQFSAGLLENGRDDLGSIARLDLQQDDGNVSIRLEGMAAARAAYVELTYDPLIWELRESSLQGIMPGLSISLVAQLEPGVLQLGSVLTDPLGHEGLSGSHGFAELQFARPGDVRPQRGSNQVNTTDKARPVLEYDETAGGFIWLFSNPGDYDQNGLVNISDLTPLGINFGASGPFVETSAQWVVDGDGNGQINISDISPIGASFGNRVERYSVFSGSLVRDYPAGNGMEPILETFHNSVAVAEGSGNPAMDRLSYFLNFQPDSNTYYWVRAAESDNYGTPSAPLSGVGTTPLQLSLVVNGSNDNPLGGSGSEEDPYTVEFNSIYDTELSFKYGSIDYSDVAFSSSGNSQLTVDVFGQIITGMTDNSAFQLRAELFDPEKNENSNVLHFSFDPTILTLSIDPASTGQPLLGSGSQADPFAIRYPDEIQLRLLQGSTTDLTEDAGTSYQLSGPDANMVSAGGLLTQHELATQPYGISAQNGAESSNTLYFRPVLVYPPVIALADSETGIPGSGTKNDPHVVSPGETYDLSVTGVFGEEADTKSQYVVTFPDSADVAWGGILTVDAEAVDFNVYANHAGTITNILYFTTTIP